MNITLPFSLVSIKKDDFSVQIYPGYWFRNNMYALTRNVWKFGKRDRRFIKEQNIEADFLAPDTVEEMFEGSKILFDLYKSEYGFNGSFNELVSSDLEDEKTYIEIKEVVHGNRSYVYKPLQGIRLYRKMIRFYGIRELLRAIEGFKDDFKIDSLAEKYNNPQSSWHNIGGQLMNERDLMQIFSDIKNGIIDSWDSLHKRYELIQNSYTDLKISHGISSLLRTEQKHLKDLTIKDITGYLQEGAQTAEELFKLAYSSREKDYSNPFRISTYHSKEEMENVIGKIEDNSFLRDYKIEMTDFSKQCNQRITELNH
jgi:hypothetical protein